MKERFLRAFRSLFRSRTRSLLTVCGIGVGVFAVTIISGIGSIGTAEITATLNTMGVNAALVESPGAGSDYALTDEDVVCFAGLQGVEKAMPLMATYTETTMVGVDVSCYAWGIDNEAREIINLEALHGRLITHEDVAAKSKVCVIDESIALETYGRSNIVGKKIKLLFGGSYQEYEIVGIAKSGLSTLQGMMQGFIPQFVYLPYTTVQQVTGQGSFDKIALLLDKSGQADENIIEKLLDRVNEIKQAEDSYVVTNLLAQKKQICDIMDITVLALTVIAAISLIVSGITVLTTMLSSVGERTREIGIKKSIGAKNSDIMGEFLLESVLLASMGSLSGIALAEAICLAGCLILGVGFTVNWAAIAAVFMFSVLLGAAFGVYPASKAARLKPVEALRG